MNEDRRATANPPTSFRERLSATRPDVMKRQHANAEKRGIAIHLRDLRDGKGLTQVDVARASGMTQSMVARMESLSGPMPKIETIQRYVDACDGHMAIVISADKIDLKNLAYG